MGCVRRDCPTCGLIHDVPYGTYTFNECPRCIPLKKLREVSGLVRRLQRALCILANTTAQHAADCDRGETSQPCSCGATAELIAQTTEEAELA
jgi:hypothetical protein